MIEVDEFKRTLLNSALTGYCQSGLSPIDAMNRSLEVVRRFEETLTRDNDKYFIDALSKIEQLEKTIGNKVSDEYRYHVNEALDQGVDINTIISNNPKLVKDVSG